MAISRNLPPLPPPEIPVVDSSGKMSVEWYQWLVTLMSILDEIRIAIP
jgi:hypothetical protein